MQWIQFCIVSVFLCVCVLERCQGAPRVKRTKHKAKERAHCLQAPDPGHCDSNFRRWYYDPATDECKSFVWTGCDGNDNRFQRRGHCEKSCKVKGANGEKPEKAARPKPTPAAAAHTDDVRCQHRPCKDLSCEHGYDRGFDDNGCETCKCRSPLSSTTPTTTPEPTTPTTPTTEAATTPVMSHEVDLCPEVDCPDVFCPRGYVTDDLGCNTCECVGCPTLHCPSHLNCLHGYVVDDQTGCETCECRNPPVESSHFSAAEDEVDFGCDVDVSSCDTPCETGRVLDSRGCETCECRQEPEVEIHSVSPESLPGCPDLKRCDLSCDTGFLTDDAGCQLCACQDEEILRSEPEVEAEVVPEVEAEVVPEVEAEVVPEVVHTVCDRTVIEECTLVCPGGFDKDPDGCDTCECRPLADEKVGNHVTCPPFSHDDCASRCEFFILEQDENDCDVCSCLGDSKHTTAAAAPRAEPACPLLEDCVLDCPEGRAQTETGCEICECRQPEVVARRRDAGIVETGYTDANPSGLFCLTIDCGDLSCPGGFRYDPVTACPLCECDEPAPQHSTSSSVEAIPGSEPSAGESAGYTTWSDSFDGEIATPSPAAVSTTGHLDQGDEVVFPPEVMCTGRHCAKKCPYGFRKSDADDCYVCDCVRPKPEVHDGDRKRLVDKSVYDSRKAICALPAYRGPCHATLTRWYYNPDSGTCESFEYGGCRGYANNFRSESSCQEYCLVEVDQDREQRREWYRQALGLRK